MNSMINDERTEALVSALDRNDERTQMLAKAISHVGKAVLLGSCSLLVIALLEIARWVWH